MNTNKTETIKFFYNGIKVNGGKLIRCFYFTDSKSDSVTISARDYADLPRDMFKVKNETDLYTDYFDSDSATLTPAHPLYKYVRAAALKSAMRGEPEYIAKLEQDAQDAQQPGRYHWRKPEDIRAEIERRAKIGAIPGLREIEAARADLVNWKLEFDASFDGENGGGVGVRPKPKYDMDALYAKYPRAKAYLDAEDFAASDNDAKANAGRKTLEAIINGENHEQAIDTMNSEWAAYCESHIWD